MIDAEDKRLIRRLESIHRKLRRAKTDRYGACSLTLTWGEACALGASIEISMIEWGLHVPQCIVEYEHPIEER